MKCRADGTLWVVPAISDMGSHAEWDGVRGWLVSIWPTGWLITSITHCRMQASCLCGDSMVEQSLQWIDFSGHLDTSFDRKEWQLWQICVIWLTSKEKHYKRCPSLCSGEMQYKIYTQCKISLEMVKITKPVL